MKQQQIFLHTLSRLICSVSALIFLFHMMACNRPSTWGQQAFKTFKNPVFKQIEDEKLSGYLKNRIAASDHTFKNPKFLKAFYAKHQYAPVVLDKILTKGQLENIITVLADAGAHGLSADMFNVRQLQSLYQQMRDKNKISDTEAAYTQLAELEVLLANALTDYSHAMQYGVLSPRKIYAQYYTETKRPDEKSFSNTLETPDIKQFLDSVQPKDKQYQALQQALTGQPQLTTSAAQEEARRILVVNLERLRWKNKPREDKYVLVNIADFTLQVIEKEQAALQMKVCVGEGRYKNEPDKLIEYDEEGLKKDRPFNRETPQLNSLLHSVQVNPVWNIPQSIASNEISRYAAADPYYLANNNIDVYLNGQRIEDPETIDWTAEGAAKQYHFKQRPGAENALGKIKFLFNNQSSVYLHDTPSKKEFDKPVRAVSHGCVRVEKPLELAKALFGPGTEYEAIRKAMQDGKPRAKDIALPQKVPVYLCYYTCWADSSGQLQYRKDIYGLDMVLYSHLKRLI